MSALPNIWTARLVGCAVRAESPGAIMPWQSVLSGARTLVEDLMDSIALRYDWLERNTIGDNTLRHRREMAVSQP